MLLNLHRCTVALPNLEIGSFAAIMVMVAQLEIAYATRTPRRTQRSLRKPKAVAAGAFHVVGSTHGASQALAVVQKVAPKEVFSLEESGSIAKVV